MNYVKGYRTMADLTQAQMATMLKMSLKAYADKESGVSDFTLSQLKLIRDVLNERGIRIRGTEITIDDLILA